MMALRNVDLILLNKPQVSPLVIIVVYIRATEK